MGIHKKNPQSLRLNKHKKYNSKHNSHTTQSIFLHYYNMAEMIREQDKVSETTTPSLYPNLQPLTPAQIQANNEFLSSLNQTHPNAGLLAQVTKPPVVPEKPKTVEPPTPAPREKSKPAEELDMDGKPYPSETAAEIATSPVEKELDVSKLHWKDRPVENLVTMKNQVRKVETTVRHQESHARPIVENCQSEDDFAGFTADPVLNVICRGQKFELKCRKEKGVTKFEVRVDDQPAILLNGAEKDQMLNGFSLKVLTLGIVKTRFSFALNDTQGAKVFEAYRKIGTSTFIDVDLTYFKDAIKCGQIQPTGFNLNRITYHVYDDAKRKVFTLQGGVLRGVFSDGWDLVLPDKKKIGTYRRGVLEFKEQGVPGTATFITMKQKILAIAACQLIQLHV